MFGYRKNGKNNIKLYFFISVSIMLCWLYSRLGGGNMAEIQNVTSFIEKIPSPFVIDLFEVGFFLSLSFVFSREITEMNGEETLFEREKLIRSAILNASSGFIMMFYHPMLSSLSDAAFAVCAAVGSFSLAVLSLENTKNRPIMTVLKLLNMAFLAYLLYASFIYELIA